MATGDSLISFDPLANRPPSSDYATLDLRGDLPVLDFDASSNESAQFLAPVPSHYNGGDLTATLLWAASSATSGNAKIRVKLTRLTVGSNLDSLPSVGDSDDITDAAPATNGDIATATTGSMTVASLTAGNLLLVEVTRLATDAADTMTGDCELVSLAITEN